MSSPSSPRRVFVQTEFAVRYVPAPPRSRGEEQGLEQKALEQQGLEVTLRIARALIAHHGPASSEPFRPLLWEEAALTALAAQRARVVATPPPLPIDPVIEPDEDDGGNADGWETDGEEPEDDE